MTKSRAAAVAAVLMAMAGWITGADCTSDLLACHLMHLQRFFVAIGDVVAASGQGF